MGEWHTAFCFAVILRYLREGRLGCRPVKAPGRLAGYSPFAPAGSGRPDLLKGENMTSSAGDNVSGRLPKTEAEAALLRPAIRKLLRTIPETWAEFDLDGLTAVEDNALFCLVAAGMVERRGWYRTSILNHPTYFEVQFQATGEGGFAQAVEPAIAAEYATWGDAWRAWKAGETPDLRRFGASNRRKSGD